MSIPFSRQSGLARLLLLWTGLSCAGGCNTSAPVAGKTAGVGAETPVQIELSWPERLPDGWLQARVEVKGGLPPVAFGDKFVRPKSSGISPVHVIGGRVYTGTVLSCKEEPISPGESVLPGHFCVVLCRPINDAGSEVEIIVHTSVPVAVSLRGVDKAQIISTGKWETVPLGPPEKSSLPETVSLPHVFPPGDYEVRARKE
jgi:hypothetical protein